MLTDKMPLKVFSSPETPQWTVCCKFLDRFGTKTPLDLVKYASLPIWQCLKQDKRWAKGFEWDHLLSLRQTGDDVKQATLQICRPPDDIIVSRAIWVRQHCDIKFWISPKACLNPLCFHWNYDIYCKVTLSNKTNCGLGGLKSPSNILFCPTAKIPKSLWWYKTKKGRKSSHQRSCKQPMIDLLP